MNRKCPFCNPQSADFRPERILYQDATSLAFLSLEPVNKGHTLVIPRAHYETFLQTPPRVLEHLILVVQEVAKGVVDATNAQGFTLGVNNGRVAGQKIDHLHFHIMPRFPRDGLPVWPSKRYGPGELEHYASAIRSSLRRLQPAELSRS